LVNATFFGWWLIQETATNTGGTTLTDFREYTIGVQGGSSSGLAGCLLQGNNLSDLENAATARTNLGVIPLSGTTVGNPVTGDVEFANFQSLYQLDASEEYEAKFTFEDGRPAIRVRQTTGTLYSAVLSIDSNVLSIVSDDPNFRGLEGISYYGANYNDNSYVQKKYVDDGLSAIRKSAYKTADETVNNTTVYVDDADMRVTIVPPSSGVDVYSFESLVILENASSTSIKYKVTTTNLAGATGDIAAQSIAVNSTVDLNSDIAVGSFNNKRITRLYGLITIPNTATTGDVIISWGQNTAIASNTTMLSPSSIILEKVN
jgi:hypothetical protein